MTGIIKKTTQVLDCQEHLKKHALLKRQVEESALDKKTIEETGVRDPTGQVSEQWEMSRVIQARREVSFTMEVPCKEGKRGGYNQGVAAGSKEESDPSCQP